MADRTCGRCGRIFKYPSRLAEHQKGKKPCDPILETATGGDENRCKYCGRTFASYTSMRRHVRHSCKIANSEEGMDRLMEHTLQRQNAALAAKVDAQNEKIDKLTALVEQISQLPACRPRPAPAGALANLSAHIGTINVTNVMQVSAVVNIKSFDSEDRICIPVALVKAAFTENPRLMEYCRMTDEERTDADKAAPYVLEALIDLVRRAHRDPLYRNVHLNPRRADQVMVCIGEEQRWEVRGLIDVIRVLFDGVADNLHRLIVTDKERAQLPLDVQSAASWVPNLYEDEPERFVKDGRGSMAAHLANTGPAAPAVSAMSAMLVDGAKHAGPSLGPQVSTAGEEASSSGEAASSPTPTSGEEAR